jgi:hypothetical protein
MQPFRHQYDKEDKSMDAVGKAFEVHYNNHEVLLEYL